MFRSISVVLFATILIASLHGDAIAAASDEQTSVLNLVVYVLIGVAVVIALIAMFNNDLFTRILGRLGQSSGDERGPKPGEGAVIHHSSGEADFDGSPESIRPPIRDAERELRHPTKQAAD